MPLRPLPRAMRAAAAGLGLAVAALAAAEALGWPFLARPAERYLAHTLERPVVLGGNGFSLHLLGGIRLHLGRLEVGNPDWSTLGPMVQADDARLHLRYADLLAARHGRPLAVASLAARSLDVRLERTADGRASWHFGAPSAAPQASPIHGLDLQQLVVDRGRLTLADAPAQVRLQADVATRPDALNGRAGWVAEGQGDWQGRPLTARLRTGATAVAVGTPADAPALPLAFDLQAGQARAEFNGAVQDLLGRAGVQGRYTVSGTSLAALGKALGLTLPTTPAFSLRGSLTHEPGRWSTVVESAPIGRSRLHGRFDVLQAPDARPLLTGQLNGSLRLADLGPAVGTAAPGAGAPAPVRAPGRVLPDRSFDLPSLSAMDADVRIDLDRLEFDTPQLQAMQPLRGHLVLRDGVLALDELDAHMAQGQLSGRIRLDARQALARWDVDLALSGVRIEQWIRQTRAAGDPPYVAGRMAARLQLQGRGRSTADLLASADGRGWLVWTDGRVSHLAVEAAGVDLAQALGVLVRGDDALPVQCGAADLEVRQGRVVPRVLVVDTADSTLWGDGSLSLASERLDLVARVAPKDFSPLALRSPVRVQGTLGQPEISVEKGPLARRLVPAALLGAMVGPLAALLPLVDLGDDESAAAADACRRALAQTRHTPPL